MYTIFMLSFETLQRISIVHTISIKIVRILFFIYSCSTRSSAIYIYIYICKLNRIKSLFPSGKRDRKRERENGRGYKGLFET